MGRRERAVACVYSTRLNLKLSTKLLETLFGCVLARILSYTKPDACQLRQFFRAVVGIAVGKIGNGHRLALGLVWLLVSNEIHIFDSTWSEIM